MKHRMSPSRALFLVFDVLLLSGIAFVCLAPVWHVTMASFSSPAELNVSKGLVIWPLGDPDAQAYRIILQYKKLWNSYRNTICYIFCQCLLTGILTIIAGYVFSRKRLFYRNGFMLMISFTMLFNGGMIPTYMVIRSLKMIDTPFAMVIPGCLTVFNVLLMRTSMQEIPDELEEAARIDGASELTVMFRVILPLCKATFAVIMLFTAVAKWNDYMSAMLYLPTASEYYPLQMILREILVTSTTDITSTTSIQNSMSIYKKAVEYAAIVVSTLPILCIYPFVQKYFVSGVTLGAVKS